MNRRGPSRVLICGAYGFGNLGDEAILEAIVEDVWAVESQAELSVITWEPAATSRRLPICTIQASETSALKAVWSHDLVLCGGGAILAEYGRRRSFLNHLRGSPGYPLTMVTWASLLGKASMIYGVGVEEIGNPILRAWTRLACRLANGVTVRDTASARLLTDWGVPSANVQVTADPVFGLKRPRIQSLSMSPRKPVRRPAVAIGICYEPLHTPDRDLIVEYYVDLVHWLVGNKEMSILFIPMNTNPRFDSEIMTEIQKHVKTAELVNMTETAAVTGQVLAALSQVDLVISSRMHLLILAALSSTPLIAVSRGAKGDSKLNSLMDALGQEAPVALDMRALPNMKARINTVIDSAPQMRATIAGRCDALRSRAQQNRTLIHSLLVGGSKS